MIEQLSLLFRQSRETFFEKDDCFAFRRQIASPGLLNEMMLEEFVPVFRQPLVPERLPANEIKGYCTQPLPEIGAGLEVHDMPVGKDKGLVGNLVDEMRHGQFHGHEGPQMGTVKLKKPLKRLQITPLHARDKVLL